MFNVVQSVLKEEKPSKGCEKMFQFAAKIPHPSKATKKQMSALCTSVSQSRPVGLECFFQYDTSISETRSILCPIGAFGCKEEVAFNNISYEIEDHNREVKLGWFVRYLLPERSFSDSDHQ